MNPNISPQKEIPVKKPLKEMSKAERRELQERQRAEKEIKKSAGLNSTLKGFKKPAEAPKNLANSHNKTKATKSDTNVTPTSTEKKRGSKKGVGLFSHLEGGSTKDGSVSEDEVHPVVVEIALQIKSYAISGSNARCIAMLLAFKRVIADYATPPDTPLCRHLITHLSPMIRYLKFASGRPLALAMGNAIRYLKREISTVDPDLTDEDAKSLLADRIDNFIRDQIIVADHIIATNALEKIQPNDVILTYGGSSLIFQALTAAHEKGVSFRVIIVDSGPRFEGKHMARKLVEKGVECTYVLLAGVAYIVKEATKVFLGAHGLFSNGTLLARAGTAMVALAGHHQRLPVIVCCETYKFSDKVRLDSVVWNEIGDARDLLAISTLDYSTVSAQAAAEEKAKNQVLEANLNAYSNLHFLNLLYDLTPAEYLTVVVTEVGLIPCTSVPVVLREYGPLLQ